jgi:hypothetical protein
MDASTTGDPQTAVHDTGFDPADFVTELHDEGLWPLNAGGDPQVPDSSTSDGTENDDHLTVYLM